jgi:catechol 2,3-dioxygenase-like lactoylglutathione lyase family enzyme
VDSFRIYNWGRVISPLLPKLDSLSGGKRSQLMQVMSLDHIHIYAANPKLSANFYIEHFGAKQIVQNTNVNGDTRIFLALGGQVLVLGSFPVGLTPMPTPGPPPEPGDGGYRHGFGVAHFGLRVANVDLALVELSESSVPVLSQPVREQSGLTYAYIAAPDGVVIELTQYASPA